MKRYPSPKLAARMHYSILKTTSKIKQKNAKTREIAIILETAKNIAKYLKFQA